MWVKFCSLLMLKKKQVHSIPSVCHRQTRPFGISTHTQHPTPHVPPWTSVTAHIPPKSALHFSKRNDAFASHAGSVISIEKVLLFFPSFYKPDSLVSSEPMRCDQALQGVRFSMNILHCGSGGPGFNKCSIPDTKELDISF